jgi:hypothetical protein
LLSILLVAARIEGSASITCDGDCEGALRNPCNARQITSFNPDNQALILQFQNPISPRSHRQIPRDQASLRRGAAFAVGHITSYPSRPMDSVTAAAARFRVLVSRGLVALGFKDDAFLLFVAAIVGVITAGAAVGFHALIDRIRDALYGIDPNFLYGPGSVLLIFFPMVGGLLVGIIAMMFSRDAQTHGIIDVMESVIRSAGFVRPIKAIEKIFTSAVTIGSGGSAGAEGPIVQIGAAIASGFGGFFRLSRSQMPLIVGCGAAAGISRKCDHASHPAALASPEGRVCDFPGAGDRQFHRQLAATL